MKNGWKKSGPVALTSPLPWKSISSCRLDIEIHETETHKKYAEVARKEGNEAVAAVFDELSSGEDYFSERLQKTVKESK